jgi:hypothetical protein
MSEIKVNKISPKQTCTQLTLGDSGDTIIVTSGANFNTDGIKNLNTSSIITQTNATTITLGYSGSTIAIASGATQTGIGRQGAVNWDTTKKTTGFTAVNGVGYFCDTTSTAFTVTLPATPSAGDIVAVSDYTGTWATNNLTVGRNSSNINGYAEDLILNQNNITATLIYVDATEGWRVIDTGSLREIDDAQFLVATGGTETTCGDFKIHSFTGPGTFTVSSVGNSAGSNTIQTLIVAGGGGGGRDRGSGAGAGGLILTPSAGIPVSATGYPISIGGGGAGGTAPSSCGVAGTPTTGFSLTAVGGGRGRRGGIGGSITGGPGGSGGGGSIGCSPATVGPGGPGTQPTQPGNSGAYGFGNNGGAANPPGSPLSSGGGGGAGAVGGVGQPGVSGAGGAGKDATPIFGASPKTFYGPTNGVYAGGGGGGSTDTSGPGGLGGSGGGGPGGKSPANLPGPGIGENGTTNTGGGGGGGTNTTPTQNGGTGGSGIVLIRYKFK